MPASAAVLRLAILSFSFALCGAVHAAELTIDLANFLIDVEPDNPTSADDIIVRGTKAENSPDTQIFPEVRDDRLLLVLAPFDTIGQEPTFVRTVNLGKLRSRRYTVELHTLTPQFLTPGPNTLVGVHQLLITQAPPAVVPLLSPLGMFILAAVFAILGLLRHRRST